MQEGAFAMWFLLFFRFSFDREGSPDEFYNLSEDAAAGNSKYLTDEQRANNTQIYVLTVKC